VASDEDILDELKHAVDNDHEVWCARLDFLSRLASMILDARCERLPNMIGRGEGGL
jgi:hypothetical protein